MTSLLTAPCCCLFISFLFHSKDGGVASGFRHVVTNEADYKVLLHVKGRCNVQGNEVKMDWSSFNSGDCFIIVLGLVIRGREHIIMTS